MIRRRIHTKKGFAFLEEISRSRYRVLTGDSRFGGECMGFACKHGPLWNVADARDNPLGCSSLTLREAVADLMKIWGRQ